MRWYANWRRYVYCPKGNTLLDENCLGEITAHIAYAMEDWINDTGKFDPVPRAK